jgi:hypothetical protein
MEQNLWILSLCWSITLLPLVALTLIILFSEMLNFFFNFFFQITKRCKGNILNLQVYFICRNENFKSN